MYKIYGSPGTSAGRCYWMLEELGVPYERVPLSMSQREHKSPEYLKINPNGKVPTLTDGEIVIWESMAINSYLAAKHNPDMLGKNPQEIGQIQQWSYWSILEVQKHAIEWFIQVKFVPDERRDLAVIEKAQKNLIPLFNILNNKLENQKFLVGNRFTLADLNVSSTVNVAQMMGWNFKDTPHLETWFKACHDRPAWHKVCSLPQL